jgi:hypothetical protein
MIVDVVRVSPLLEIERKFCLPVPGEVLVEKGAEVNPGDVIAQTQVPGKLITLDIAKGLRLSVEETTASLMREIGQMLEEGDVIAQSGKTLPRLFRAPVNGKIVDYYQGQLILATGSTKIECKAKIIGRVKEIIPEYGVVISTLGSLLQGVWGNGLSGCGVLHVAASKNSEPVVVSDLDDVENGDILACSVISEESVIKQYLEKDLSGLIVGALPPRLVQNVLELSFPVILLQSFGAALQAVDLFDLLASSQGEMVCVNACAVDYFNGKRPEVIIPKEAGEPERYLGFKKTLEVGDQVRFISGKPIYQVGKVVELFEEEQPFENGIFLPAAVVKLKTLEKVRVPQQNLWVIG